MNKKIIILVLSLFLLFLIVIVQAKTLEINLAVQGLDSSQHMELYQDSPIYYTIFLNYSVEFYSLNVYGYDALTGEDEESSFRAQLVSSSGKILAEKNFEPSFLILSDPPTETDFDIVSLEFPFIKNVRYLKVYYNDEEKLNLDISAMLCDNNGVCEDEENYYSCSSDCKWYDADGICLGYSGDKFCDVDCFDDSDCHIENCNDGIQNQDEITVDSGGVCAQGNCYDGIKNDNETGVDCGGNCFARCEEETIDIDFLISEWQNDNFGLLDLMRTIKSFIFNN